MRKTRRIGGYTAVRALGAEGFTDLYAAEDPSSREPVLLRVCRASEPEIGERFRAEASRASGVRHEHIVPVLRVGSRKGSVFVAESASGNGSLAALLEKGALPPPEERLELLRQVAAALVHAHGQGLLHRDLKPARIQVFSGGTARLAGFGTGKMLSAYARLTDGDDALPDAGYLAPEQIEGRRPDGRSDIFGFGLVAYELFTAQRAFPAASLSGLYQQLASCEPLTVNELWTDCPPQIAALVARCLHREPEARYQDFAQVLAALEDAGTATGRRTDAGAARPAARAVEVGTTPPTAEPPEESVGAADAPTIELTLPTKALPSEPARAVDRAEAIRPEASRVASLASRSRELLQRALDFLRTVPRGVWLGAGGALLFIVLVVLLGRSPRAPEEAASPEAPAKPDSRRVAGPQGRVFLDARPWGELTRLLDGTGKELPLPAVRQTPLLLELPPGSFEAVFSVTGAEEPATCAFDVVADTATNCLIEARELTANDYFKGMGWWR